MSRASLVTAYILEARAQSLVAEERLNWLQTEQRALGAEMRGGDWEARASAFEGSSHTVLRGTTAEQRFRACAKALELLTINPDVTAASSSWLIPQFLETPEG